MKMKLLQKKGQSLAAMFTAVVIACLGLAQQCEAGVTWLVSQQGDDLVLESCGSLKLRAGLSVNVGLGEGTGAQALNGYQDVIWRRSGPSDHVIIGTLGGQTAGAVSGGGLIIYLTRGTLAVFDVVGDASKGSGGTFGFYGDGRICLDIGAYDSRWGATIVPRVTMVFADITIAEVFGTNLDNGPVVAFVADGTGDTISVALGDGCVRGLAVDIDIKPGSAENTVNLGSKGVTKVAILGSDEFNATEVDPLTVELADATVRVKGNGQPLTTIQDTNGDGFLDLVLHVDTEGFTLTDGDVSAELTGSTFGGDDIYGEDVVRVVP